MNRNLSQVGKQLLGIWKQLGLNQRLTLVSAGSLVVLAMIALIIWSSRSQYSLLYGRLDEAEAANVVAALDESKVPYKISRGGGAISVPADKVHLVRMQLAAKGIPRGEGVGFEIFDKPNFGISDFVQRANYLRAVQGELARTISQVDSIDTARVMIVMPENRLLVDNKTRPTASVFVRVRSATTLSDQTVNAVRFLVANSVEGLAVNDVSVVDNLGNVLSDSAEVDSMVGLTGSQLSARKELEQYLARKAQDMLDRVLGPGQSVIRVAADIDFESMTTIEEKYDPEGQVTRTSTEDEEQTQTSSGSSETVPVGVASNTGWDPVVTNTVASPVNNTTTLKTTKSTDYELNRTVSNLIKNPGGIKRLSAAVFVAAQYTGSGTNRVVQPRTPEELLKIQRVVQTAIGIQEAADGMRQDEIVVEEMPFNDQPLPEVQQLQHQQRWLFWLDLARKGVYPAAALALLFVFWRMLKRTPVETIPLGVPVGELSATGQRVQTATGGGMSPNRERVPPGTVTPEVLNKLVQENPGNLTHAIRAWMSTNN